jgi:colanic acid/amylovoran biosynthesis protein
MNILLLNAHSPQNAGDLAILQESLACLRTAYSSATITVAINDAHRQGLPPDAAYVDSLTRWLVQIGPAGEWRWRKPLALPYAAWLVLAALLHRLAGWRWLPRDAERGRLMSAYYDADVVAVIGGGHLYARHAFNIAFLWLWLGLALALILGKPLVLLPQSFGPLPGSLQRGLLRWLLNRSALVAAREYRSLRFLAEIGLRQRALVLPDLAFAMSAAAGAAPVAFERMIGDASRPLVGLTLMDWGGQNPGFRNQPGYESAILALIDHLQRCYNATIVLFAQCYGPVPAHDDRLIARRIAAASAKPVTVIDAALAPAELQAAYGHLDLLIATRMHSAIFALSVGTPALAIGYLHKSVGIMEMLGLTRYVLDIDTIDAQRLCMAVDRLWDERPAVCERLAVRIPAMRSTLRALPALLQKSLRVSPASIKLACEKSEVVPESKLIE